MSWSGPLSSSAPNDTGEQGGEVDEDEARRADRRLQQPAQEVEREHVEADVEEADMEEGRR